MVRKMTVVGPWGLIAVKRREVRKVFLVKGTFEI
jgi:hypothetical protein